MEFLHKAGSAVVNLIEAVYSLLWGDIVTLPLPGGGTLGLSILVLILVPAGIYFTVRTRFMPFRMFPEMIRVTVEKRNVSEEKAISGVQALIVSTATRVGMGNLVLDVGYCAPGILHGLRGGNPGPALQRKRSPLRGIQGRPGLLHTQLFYHEKGE